MGSWNRYYPKVAPIIMEKLDETTDNISEILNQTVPYDPSVSYDDQRVWGMPLLLIISLVGLGTAAIVYPIFYKKKEFSNNPTYRLILSMGVNDCIGLATATIGYVISFTSVRINIQLLIGALAQLGWFNVSSHLVVLAINRLITVAFPARRRFVYTKKTTYVWVAVAWLFGILNGLLLTPGLPVAYRALTWDSRLCGLKLYVVNPEGLGHAWLYPYQIIWHGTVFIMLVGVYGKILSVMGTVSNTSTHQRQLCFQMGIVSSNFCLAVVLFAGLIADNFMKIGNACVLKYFLQISWFSNLALNPIIYLLINKRLREMVINKFRQSDKNRKDCSFRKVPGAENALPVCKR